MNRADAWNELLDAIQATWPVERFMDVGIVVGCSGGADSTALLRGLADLMRHGGSRAGKGFLVAAHFNHRLRGVDSEQDAEFVASLAAAVGAEFESARGSGEERDEATCRDQRRMFFSETARRRGARYIALGHSRDDNAETVLHRMLRGTGPRGLAGMPPFRTLSEAPTESDFVIARPMLSCSRDLIREALSSRGFPWREDASNQSSEYQRNWIRNELLPAMEVRYPDSRIAIARSAELQSQWAGCIDSLVELWISRRVQCESPLTLLCSGRDRAESGDAVERLLRSPAVTTESLRRCWHQRRWPLQAMGQAQWTMLQQMIAGEGSAAISLPGGLQAHRSGQSVVITEPSSD